MILHCLRVVVDGCRWLLNFFEVVVGGCRWFLVVPSFSNYAENKPHAHHETHLHTMKVVTILIPG